MSTQQSNSINDNVMMTPQQASNFLGVSIKTLHSWVKSNKVPHTLYNNYNIRFRVDLLTEFRESKTIFTSANADVKERKRNVIRKTKYDLMLENAKIELEKKHNIKIK